MLNDPESLFKLINSLWAAVWDCIDAYYCFPTVDLLNNLAYCYILSGNFVYSYILATVALKGQRAAKQFNYLKDVMTDENRDALQQLLERKRTVLNYRIGFIGAEECGYVWGEAGAHDLLGRSILGMLRTADVISRISELGLTDTVSEGVARLHLAKSLKEKERLGDVSAPFTREVFESGFKDPPLADAGGVEGRGFEGKTGGGRERQGDQGMRAQERFDAFVSYNGRDRQSVVAICASLEKFGKKLWLDKETIAPGDSIQQKITEAVTSTDAALIFLGPHGLGRWQRMEQRALVSRFHHRNLRIIPILLPGVEAVPEDAALLDDFRHVVFRDVTDECAVDELLRAL